MKPSQPEFVAIPEVESEIVAVDVRLPWINAHELGINIKRLEKLCRLAGISHLSIHTTNEEERGSDVPMILGIGSDGSGVGAFAKAKKKTHDTEVKAKGVFKGEKYIDVKITFNNKDLEKQVREAPAGGVKSTEPWAKIFNQELRNAIRRIGLTHLLSPGLVETGGSLFAGVATAFQFGALWGALSEQAHLMVPLGAVSGGPMLINLAVWLSGKGRFSLFFPLAMELDRAAIFFIMSHTQNLVQALEAESACKV